MRVGPVKKCCEVQKTVARRPAPPLIGSNVMTEILKRLRRRVWYILPVPRAHAAHMRDEPALRALAAHYRLLFTPQELQARLQGAQEKVSSLLSQLSLQETRTRLGLPPEESSQSQIDAVAREVRALLWAMS